MNRMNWWYLESLKKCTDFSGRARRKEYWMFQLDNLAMFILLSIIERSIAGGHGAGALASFYALIILLPGTAVAVRRLHDVGRTGWWLLASVVPLIGFFLLLFFLASDSEPGVNQYGQNPKMILAT